MHLHNVTNENRTLALKNIFPMGDFYYQGLT